VDREKGLRELPVAREGLWLIIFSLLLSVLLFFAGNHMALRILSAVTFFFFLFCAYFFRNPRRHPDETGEVLISPADGTVIEIGEARADEFLEGSAVRVCIFMSPADVHVNRAPLAGTVGKVEHRRGDFAMAFKKDCDKENERNYILLDSGGDHLLLVQIAGFLARRIICYVKPGDRISQGQAVGMIAFGSRVDVYLPKVYEPVVYLHQKVKAGKTTLGRKRGNV
jgi:phosphatidylserine decarboxylase